MDERVELLVLDYRAGRYTRRQFVKKALGLGVGASMLPLLLEMAGKQPMVFKVPTAEAAAPQRTVIIGKGTPTVRPDPPIVVEFGDLIVLTDNITEGLTRNKIGSTDLEPCLAESWDISPDGRTYTFHLRPASFHDGTPVTARAVKLSYDRQTDDKNPFHYPGMGMIQLVFGNMEKIEAVDSNTLRFVQKRPDVALLANLALGHDGIVSPTALAKYGKEFALQPVGSGPFKFVRWERNVQFVEAAFEGYWGGRPRLDQAIFRDVPDSTVRLQSLLRGELDVMLDVDFKDVNRLSADKRFKLIIGNFHQHQYIYINHRKPPFDNKEVRRAIHFAINKENIGKVIFFGNYAIGAGPLVPGTPGYDPSLVSMYAYNPNRAKQLLQAAGISEGFPVTLTHRTVGFWPQEAQLVQSDLQAVGLKVTLEALDDASFFARLNAGQHQMALNDWTNVTGDLSYPMVGAFSSARTDFRLGYRNPEVEKLNAEAQVERNPDKRKELYLKAQRLVMEDGYVVVLGYPKNAMAAKANIQGLVLSPLRLFVLRGLTIS
jgi:peptide/nickel transport system substrate-binding protein